MKDFTFRAGHLSSKNYMCCTCRFTSSGFQELRSMKVHGKETLLHNFLSVETESKSFN